jgi:hypothetical protein
MPGTPSNALTLPRRPSKLARSLASSSNWRIGLAAAAALLTWGLTATAGAAEFGSPIIDTGVAQGCSSALATILDLDSMLFEVQRPACGGFRAFDLAFLGVVALIVISAIRFRHATSRHRLELARRMVEKGLEPPPELVGSNTGSDLRRGLVLVFTGLGLLFASLLGAGETLSPAGLIPGFIGVGYLISHRFAVRRQS